nr:tetratricopeptide repeat protein [uncultured Rhodopila sp.]
MALMAKAGPPARHPWLDEFIRAPEQAFGDLLAGYAKIFPYGRADAPDAARMLFGGLAVDDPARQAVGPAILGWLANRRRTAPPADRPLLQRWIREVCEAFEIVALLEVEPAAVPLRRQFVVWNEWAARFSLTPARDARAEYWRMLALTQPLLPRAAAAEADSLAPLWLEICRQAGGALPRRYLSIGLLGLRRLPDTANGKEAPWLAGLAQWAMARRPTDAEFAAEWRALKPLYPRRDARWRELVGRLLDTKPFRDAEIVAPAWWGGDPDFAPLKRPDFRRTGEALRSPSPEDCNALIDRLGEPWQRIAPRIDLFLQRHRHFLSATGDSYYFVRAIHALGGALIRPGTDQPHDRAATAQALVREGLDWRPYDRHLWSLWREALKAGGALEAAERVGWEFIRRDPDHVEGRNQLATLLADALGRPVEAEALLRETIAAFPGNVVARAQLATLLADALGRPAEAEALLRETIAAFPGDVVARNQLAECLIAVDRLPEAEAVVDAAFKANVVNEVTYALRARLQSHRGRATEAAATLREGLARFPSNTVLSDYQRILAAGRPLRLRNPASHAARPPEPSGLQPASLDDPALAGASRYGRVRRLRFRAESPDLAERDAALAEIKAILRDDPAFAYAELLAARLRIWQAQAGTLPGFAAAFEQALAEEDRARLEALAKRQPRLEALTLLARAILGDEQAAWLTGFLRAEPAADEARAVTVLRHGLQLHLAEPSPDSVRHWLTHHRDSALRVLHDANEAGLADRLVAA